MVTVIVGFGCVGMMKLMAAGSMANGDATELTTAMMLANNIREATQTSNNFSFSDPVTPTNWGRESGEAANTPAGWDDLDDFDGAVLSPPIDARRKRLSNYSNWTQSITVQSMDPNRIWSTMGHGSLAPSARPMSRVTVAISHAGHQVCTSKWMVAYAP